MRSFFLMLTLLAASVAVADIGPGQPRCVVPSSCVTCQVQPGTELNDPCVVKARESGLERQQCSDKFGANVALHYCPSGMTATRPGCSAAPGLVGVALLALTVLARRRRVGA
jgi:hypothetical protein